MELYKLKPALIDYLWGGTELIKNWNKNHTGPTLGESWELSMHEAGKTTIAAGEKQGQALADVITKADYGVNGQGFDRFPAMVKLIDAGQNLSLQVHPSDPYALAHEGELGKTEMWYILAAKEGAGIYCGMKQEVTPEQYSRHIEENRLEELLNFYPVKPGESYFIPAGTVHAICEGLLVLEVQQNSNITYRVYDFNRRDEHGNLRELHIEQAKAVSTLTPYRAEDGKRQIAPGIRQLAANRYFSVYEYECDDTVTFEVDGRSFASLTFVEGSGSIGEHSFQKGESFFAPAGLGAVTVTGKSRFVLTKLVRYYIGIDIGGTDIKGAILDEEGRFMAKKKVACEAHLGSGHVINNVGNLVESLLAEAGLTLADTEGIGMGIPGIIDGQNGRVAYSNNLRWKDVPIVELLKKRFDTNIRITNDANAAGIGEVKFGAGKQYDDVVFITLGTGLGGGIVIGGRLFEGNHGAGAELGHMAIQMDGELCTCGRKGCLEAYASATALIRDAKKAALAHPESEMWKHLPGGDIEKMNGRIPFDCRHTDPAAAQVVENYISYLGEGLASIANIFRPQAILIGGGISNEGEGLLLPLREKVAQRIFGGDLGPKVELGIAALGNDAGVCGAAALLL